MSKLNGGMLTTDTMSKMAAHFGVHKTIQGKEAIFSAILDTVSAEEVIGWVMSEFTGSSTTLPETDGKTKGAAKSLKKVVAHKPAVEEAVGHASDSEESACEMSQEEEKRHLEKMTVAQLQAFGLAQGHALKVLSKKKADLIEFLMNNAGVSCDETPGVENKGVYLAELKAECKNRNIPGATKLDKAGLVSLLKAHGVNEVSNKPI
jgi:hypothetical protein